MHKHRNSNFHVDEYVDAWQPAIKPLAIHIYLSTISYWPHILSVFVYKAYSNPNCDFSVICNRNLMIQPVA